MAGSEDEHRADGDSRRTLQEKENFCRNRHGGGSIRFFTSERTKVIDRTLEEEPSRRLVSIDGKEIIPGRAALLSVSDGVVTVEEEVLVLDEGIELLIGEDILKKPGTRMKIGARPKIFIAEMLIGALADEENEKSVNLVMQKVYIPARSMKIVATRPEESTRFGAYALVEPPEGLMIANGI